MDIDDKITLVHFSWLLHVAKTSKINTDEVLHRADLSSEKIQNPNTKIDIKTIFELYRLISESTNTHSFSLLAGENIALGEYGLNDYISASSPTVLSGFENLVKYFSIIAPASMKLKFTLQKWGGLLEFNPDHRLSREISWYEKNVTEFTFSLFMSRIRYFTGLNLAPIEVNFKHTEPDYSKEYNRIFTIPANFNSYSNSLLFTHECLNHKHTETRDSNLNNIVLQFAKIKLDDVEHINSFQFYVINALSSTSNQTKITMDIVLKKLNITQRTLHRRLNSEGVTFIELRDSVVKEKAIKYLKTTSIPVNKIAEILGYSSLNAFHRTFKRLTGVTPKKFRESFKSA